MKKSNELVRMNVIIDIGNTQSKLAIFSGDELIRTIAYDNPIGTNHVQDFYEQTCPCREMNAVIISSVTGHNLDSNDMPCNPKKVIELNTETSLPLENLYKTPETLGSDRLSAAVGANAMFPDENVLVLDAGTCITYDLVNSKNQYMGGSISPGIDMRFMALKDYTGKLPLLSNKNQGKTVLTGMSTNDSILSGVLNGAMAEVGGTLDSYRTKYTGLKILVTGGRSEEHTSELQSHSFISYAVFCLKKKNTRR